MNNLDWILVAFIMLLILILLFGFIILDLITRRRQTNNYIFDFIRRFKRNTVNIENDLIPIINLENNTSSTTTCENYIQNNDEDTEFKNIYNV